MDTLSLYQGMEDQKELLKEPLETLAVSYVRIQNGEPEKGPWRQIE